MDVQDTDLEFDSVNWPENTRLLVVEDNKVNQEVVIGILEVLGLSANIACNGKHALEKIAVDENTYDLILMDCQMPEMDGYEATKCIRAGDAGETNRNTPIIAMTANAMQGDREKCIQSGMNDYLCKPIDIEEFYRQLIKWIKNDKRAKIPIDNPNKKLNHQIDIPTTNQSDLEQSVAHNKVIWDRDAVLKRVLNKTELLTKILKSYLESTPEIMTSLAEEIEQKNTESIIENAHKIKGMSANISAEVIASCASQLELAGNADDFTQIKLLYDELSIDFKKLQTVLTNYLNQK